MGVAVTTALPNACKYSQSPSPFLHDYCVILCLSPYLDTNRLFPTVESWSIIFSLAVWPDLRNYFLQVFYSHEPALIYFHVCFSQGHVQIASTINPDSINMLQRLLIPAFFIPKNTFSNEKN